MSYATRLLGIVTFLSQKKKDVGMGLLVLSLYNMSCLHTAIPTPSFCGFWHGHPYIPLHFLKMFLYLFASFFLHKGTIKYVLQLKLLSESSPNNESVTFTAIATGQERGLEHSSGAEPLEKFRS